LTTIDLFDLDVLADQIKARALRDEVLQSLATDPARAHQIVFGAGHPFKSPEFHGDIIAALHSDHPRVDIEAFRGAAKSTLAEETMLLAAASGAFRYGLILGNTYTAATQRLATMKSMIDNNDVLRMAFGNLHGPVWSESKIRLTNGVVIAVVGARQSIRGAKEDVSRPDYVLIDDLEDESWVKDPDVIEANKLWLFREIIPALASAESTPIRMIGTPLAENSLLRQLSASQEWRSSRFPIRYIDQATGELTSAWPEKFSLDAIGRIEERYRELGAHRAFMQEYMCVSESEGERVFTASMLTVEPRVRTWQAVYTMTDPARTTKKGSAQTGWAAWSWFGNRLDIWECDGAFLKPDQIVQLQFDLWRKYHPVEMGVEADGLEEWLMQPIRDAQLKLGVIPVTAMRAPKGKVDFIKGLQPHFAGGTARFCEESGDGPDKFRNARAQFLTFPRDVIDAPNALAYALPMKAGLPVYPDFSVDSVDAAAEVLPSRAAVLAMNADGSRVTGMLVQDHGGVTVVLGEWIEEGQASDVAAGIVREATIAVGRKPVVVIGRDHITSRYSNHGLNQALHRAAVNARPGGDSATGRAEVQALLRRRLRGLPGLMVSDRCRFVLNGFSAGFSYPVRFNQVASEPKDGLYRTLIEGLEHFMASAIVADDEDQVGNFQHTNDGRRYRSAMRT
jgi:hypothetical protein